MTVNYNIFIFSCNVSMLCYIQYMLFVNIKSGYRTFQLDVYLNAVMVYFH